MCSLGRMQSRIPHALSLEVDWHSRVEATVSYGPPTLGSAYVFNSLIAANNIYIVTAERKVDPTSSVNNGSASTASL